MAGRALTIPTIFTAVDKFTAVTKNMGTSVASFASKTEIAVARSERAFRKLTPALSEVQSRFLEYASAAVVAGAAVSAVHFSVRSIMDYETALHSLEAVTGQSASKYRTQIESIAKKTKESAIDVASSFEVIGSAMSQYLDNPAALTKITEAGITLSKASRMELTPTLQALTSVMNQFKLGADDANNAINRLTAGEIVGSVSTAKIAEGLQEFGANAYAANVKLSESVALLETLGKQMDHDKIAVGARNILNIISSAEGLPKEAQESLKKHGVNLSFLMDKSQSLGARLTELSKIQGDAVAVSKVFGKENMTAGNVIFANLDIYKKWANEIETTNKAQEQAAANSDTLSKAITQAKNSFVNMLVSSGKLNSGLESVKNVAFFVANNMQEIVTVGTTLLKLFIAWKALNITVTAAMWAYNLALAVNTTLQGKSKAMTIAANVIYGLYVAGVTAVTAAQWLLNAALLANPIGLVIAGIVALIALVAVVVKKWNDWGAALSLFMGPLGFIISLFQSFRRNWDMIVKAFKTDGIIGGLKAIGKTILDAVLMPLQQFLGLLAKIPGMKWAGNIAADIGKFRSNMGVNVTTDESGQPLNQPLNPKKTEQESLIKTMQTTNVNKTTIVDFKNVPKGVNIQGDDHSITPSLGSTVGG